MPSKAVKTWAWNFNAFLPPSTFTYEQLINISFKTDGFINGDYCDWSKYRNFAISTGIIV